MNKSIVLVFHNFNKFTSLVKIVLLILVLQPIYEICAYHRDYHRRPHNQLQPQQQQQQHCSQRLENALEHSRRRSIQSRKERSLDTDTQSSPYALYNFLYGHRNPDHGDNFYNSRYNESPRINDFSSEENIEPMRHRPEQLATASTVNVEDLHVKVPPNTATHWVAVEKCNYSTENATLDTRLIFPDLTLSGKVVLQPTGGKCHMILRLRRAGIEFHTVPIGLGFENTGGSRRMGSASVRTDSHFSEPGFVTVFAHSCEGPSGLKYRQNTKKRFSTNTTPTDVSLSQSDMFWRRKLWERDYDMIDSDRPEADNMREEGLLDWDNRRMYDHRRYRRNVIGKKSLDDIVHFNDDIFNLNDKNFEEFVQSDARHFAQSFEESNENIQLSPDDRDSVDVAFSRELEKLFSMGVRSLLTTYMQRALQPAIKETLMENMGYRLSYGK